VLLLAWMGCLSLTGEWEGQVECQSDYGDIEQDVSLLLEPAEGGAHEGEMVMSASGTIEVGGEDYEYDLELVLDVVVEPDDSVPGEDNDLEVEGELTDCEYTLDGEDMSDDYCDDEGEDADVDGMVWAEAGLITIDEDDCEGELERE
jgi:hypothetical protein